MADRSDQPIRDVHAAGVVLFRRGDYDIIEYCVLQNARHRSWGFPKGHVEDNESIDQATWRELEEETGLTREDVKLIEDFKDETTYNVRERKPDRSRAEPFRKVVHVLAGEVTNEASRQLRLSKEHSDVAWEPLPEAMRVLVFENLQQLFKRVAEHIDDPGLADVPNGQD